jgi:hypothetical protein
MDKKSSLYQIPVPKLSSLRLPGASIRLRTAQVINRRFGGCLASVRADDKSITGLSKSLKKLDLLHINVSCHTLLNIHPVFYVSQLKNI